MKRGNRRVILILGAGIMQLPALHAARAKGWRVIVADGNPHALGVGLADEFLHIDLKDKEGMAEAAAEIRRDRLDGVFTAGTDFSTTVAWVAERLGLPGIPYSSALAAKDKGAMRKAFAREGVPSPRYVVVKSDGEESCTPWRDLAYPLVVKPVDNMGARGVRRVENEEELTAYLSIAVDQSECRTAIVEEYIPGPEFSIDALVYRGKITPCGFADRHITFPPYFVEMGHTIPSRIPKESEEAVLEVFYRGVRALGIDEGAAKGDVKLTGSGPVIGEIAARLSGGYMSGWTYPYSSGVDLTSAALNIAVGLPPGDLAPRFNRTTSERAFISIPGKLISLEGVDEAAEDTRVEDIFVTVKPGDPVTFPENNVQKCGNVIAVAPDRESACAAALNAAKRIRLRLEPGNPDTLRFLTGEKCPWAPDAFTLNSPVNRKTLDEMPDIIVPPNHTSGRDGILGIILLPDIGGEEGRDWMGRGFAASFDEFRQRYTPEVFPPKINTVVDSGAGPKAEGYFTDGDFTATIILGRVFWRVFLRGGIQAAEWLCESVLDEGSEGATVQCLVRKV
ncbi:MAG: ATP-grasp domain-containing protein [Spirochaetia bacterium]